MATRSRPGPRGTPVTIWLPELVAKRLLVADGSSAAAIELLEPRIGIADGEVWARTSNIEIRIRVLQGQPGYAPRVSLGFFRRGGREGKSIALRFPEMDAVLAALAVARTQLEELWFSDAIPPAPHFRAAHPEDCEPV